MDGSGTSVFNARVDPIFMNIRDNGNSRVSCYLEKYGC